MRLDAETGEMFNEFRNYTGIRILMEEENHPTLVKLRSWNYKMPRRFPSWETLSAAIVFYSENADAKIEDVGAYMYAAFWEKWVNQQLPIYCLSADLMADFEKTDIQGIEKILQQDWKEPFSMIPIVLPQGALTSPMGYPILTINVLVIEDAGDAEKMTMVLASDSNDNVISTAFGIMADGSVMPPAACEDKEVDAFSHRIAAIGILSLLALVFLPELVDNSEEIDLTEVAGSKKLGFGKGKEDEDKDKWRSPRWIGKTYKRQKRDSTIRPQGTHASPEAHWRKGHLRIQPYGIGLQDRRTIWIKPMWISGETP